MWKSTLLFVCLLGEGLPEMIQTQDTVAMVGEEACFTCQLIQSKIVLQVTWQKIIPGGTEDVATSSKRFGTKINPPFREKFKFKDTGLQNSIIVLRNVTKADEGCYRCLFSAYPKGTIYRKTCLTVYEQPEPILHVTKPNAREQMVVSCSVVSRTAPTVTLEVPRHEGSSNYTTVHKANADGTITVTSTVTLERFCRNGTQVHCEVCSHSGVVKKASSVIYSDKQACDVFGKSEAEGPSVFIILVVIAVVAICVGVIIAVRSSIVFRQQQKAARCSNDSEIKPMLQTAVHKTKVNLFQHDTPVKNKPEGFCTTPTTTQSWNDPEIQQTSQSPNQIRQRSTPSPARRLKYERSNNVPQMNQTPQTTIQE